MRHLRKNHVASEKHRAAYIKSQEQNKEIKSFFEATSVPTRSFPALKQFSLRLVLLTLLLQEQSLVHIYG